MSSTWSVRLVAFDDRMEIVRALREVTKKGLQECVRLAEAVPELVLEGAKQAEAEEARRRLEAAGGWVELDEPGPEVAKDGIFDLWLRHIGPRKIQVIKLVREATRLGLKESKELVESAPCLLLDGMEAEPAAELRNRLEAAGAAPELVLVGERRVCILPDHPERGDQPVVRLMRAGTEVWQQVSPLGRPGPEEKQELDDEAAAVAELERRLEDRRQSGWLVVEDELEALAAVSPRNRSLERTLLGYVDDPENPEAKTTLHVYADWLQERGDPRGELMALQLGLRGNAGLAEAVRALLDRHSGHLLGELSRLSDDLAVSWRHGFIDGIRLWQLPRSRGPLGRSMVDPVNVLRDLHALPAALLLRRVQVDQGVDAFIRALRRVGSPPALRHLVLGPFDDDDDEGEWLGDIHPLYQATPDLETLAIKGRWLELNRPNLPRLRAFSCKATPTYRDLMRQIRRARWPKLERLALWFTSQGNAESWEDDEEVEEGYRAVEIDDLRPLLAGQVELPELRHLRLSRTAFTDELVRELVRSRLARKLETLDLSWGTLTDAGARVLAEHRERLSALRQLDLRGNALTEAGHATLEVFGEALRL
jgi:uncharacterized protein (TIGR02996 family)